MKSEIRSPHKGSGKTKFSHLTAVSVLSHSMSAVSSHSKRGIGSVGDGVPLVGVSVVGSSALGANDGADEGAELGAEDGAELGANDGANEGDALG